MLVIKALIEPFFLPHRIGASYWTFAFAPGKFTRSSSSFCCSSPIMYSFLCSCIIFSILLIPIRLFLLLQFASRPLALPDPIFAWIAVLLLRPSSFHSFALVLARDDRNPLCLHSEHSSTAAAKHPIKIADFKIQLKFNPNSSKHKSRCIQFRTLQHPKLLQLCLAAASSSFYSSSSQQIQLTAASNHSQAAVSTSSTYYAAAMTPTACFSSMIQCSQIHTHKAVMNPATSQNQLGVEPIDLFPDSFDTIKMSIPLALNSCTISFNLETLPPPFSFTPPNVGLGVAKTDPSFCPCSPGVTSASRAVGSSSLTKTSGGHPLSFRSSTVLGT
nr:hypothetical protein Iba_chr06cCG18050 [Ipomoea batatas]